MLFRSLLVIAQSAQATTTYQWLLPPAAAAEGGRNLYLPLGTPVKLRTVTQFTSRDNHPGDRISLEVAESVVYRGQTIIPAGSPVTAEVSLLEHNGLFGKSGKVGLRLLDMMTPNGPVRLGGESYKQGKSQAALSIGTFLVVSWLGMFIHGTSGKVMPGAPVNAFLMDDLRFAWYPNADAARLGDSTPVQPDAGKHVSMQGLKR